MMLNNNRYGHDPSSMSDIINQMDAMEIDPIDIDDEINDKPAATTSSGFPGPAATTSSGFRGPAATTSSGFPGPTATTSSGFPGPTATTSSGFRAEKSYEQPNETSKRHLYNSNVAAMLASVKGFDQTFLDVLEDIAQTGNYVITESSITTDMLSILTIDYGNDCFTAMLKFNIFIHLMHIEECLRVLKPLISNQKFVKISNINRGQMKLEFELDGPIVLNNASVFFCQRDVLDGDGAFYTYEGRATVTQDNRFVIEFKFIKDQQLDCNAKFMVFEKPFESSFDGWQHMIRVFRENKHIARKFFGPFEFKEPLSSFLNNRAAQIDMLFDDDDSVFFNDEQKAAVYSMAYQDPRYTFVLFGPPGTGKTTTLVETIKMIRKTYKRSSVDQPDTPRFLVCTPSNSAADAFALALLSRNILPKNLIFRAIASRYECESFDPRLTDITMKRGDSFCMPDVKDELVRYQVIVSTIGFCHAFKLLGKKFFTHIIIDEAGQCMEAETFIPVSYYGREDTKVIIAGDPQQLGPVVTSNFLCNPSYGTQNSCLVRLSGLSEYKHDPRLMVQLRNNHRSHEYIVDLVSHMFYNDTLRFTRPLNHNSLVASSILNGSQVPVRFVCVYGKEVETAPSFYNLEEIQLVDYYVTRCLRSEHGLKPADIGVVCPYRESVRRMQNQFQHHRGMTVDTVEKFQGSERRIIIMTTVRTASVGFLQEYRRFNTAITRAKHMLIVIGDARLLVQDDVWKEFLFYLNRSNCFDPNTSDPAQLKWWKDFFNALGN